MLMLPEELADVAAAAAATELMRQLALSRPDARPTLARCGTLLLLLLLLLLLQAVASAAAAVREMAPTHTSDSRRRSTSVP